MRIKCRAQVVLLQQADLHRGPLGCELTVISTALSHDSYSLCVLVRGTSSSLHLVPHWGLKTISSLTGYNSKVPYFFIYTCINYTPKFYFFIFFLKEIKSWCQSSGTPSCFLFLSSLQQSLPVLCWFGQEWRHQGKNYVGAPGDFAPEMQKKRALKNKKEPLKIAIDSNVKACSMLQI